MMKTQMCYIICQHHNYSDCVSPVDIFGVYSSKEELGKALPVGSVEWQTPATSYQIAGVIHNRLWILERPINLREISANWIENFTDVH